MIKKNLLICFSSLWLCTAFGQTFVNNGATVVVTQGGQIIVKSDNVTPGSGSLENNAQSTGIFKNKGQVTIEGSFVNTSGVADGFSSSAGQYVVLQDWENNASFNADSCTVILDGGAQQITGASPTTFFNLTCNTSGTVKTQTTDAAVNGVLTLSQVELATLGNTLTINNPDPAAIVQNNANDAFISSTGAGRLIRNTNQKTEYIFPTGINENGPKIREVSIVPANSEPRTYKVRYADDPGSYNTTSQDGYDTTKKSGGIGMVNDIYYHLISASDNAPADLALFYDPTVDHTWQSIGRWQNVPDWENLLNTVQAPGQMGTNRVKMIRSAWVPTADEAHALVDTISVRKDFNFPTAFVADGQGIPSENTYFGIINQADLVTLEELSVFNRWGEMVFNSKRDGTNNWNGHYHGKLQEQGNYVFLAVVKSNATGQQYPTVTGNVSLLW